MTEPMKFEDKPKTVHFIEMNDLGVVGSYTDIPIDTPLKKLKKLLKMMKTS